MPDGYLLTKDLPAERVPVRYGEKKSVYAMRGELLVAIPRLRSTDKRKPHNFQLVKDMNVTLRAEEDEVAPLNRKDYLLLEAIKSASSRFSTFTSANKLKWALTLKKGSVLYVAVNPEEPRHLWNRSQAVVRWVGELGGKERGTVFGVEILEKGHRHRGITDGTHLMKRYFSCEDNCGMFVALDKLFCDRRGAALPLSGQRFGGRGQTKITPLPAVPPPQLGHTSVHSYDPTLALGIGSMVQVSDPPRFGVIQWIGKLQDMTGTCAGIEMEEPMHGCGDGNWKGTHFFWCEPGRGFFCPLTAVRPDERFDQPKETPPKTSSLQNLMEQSNTVKQELAVTHQHLAEAHQHLTEVHNTSTLKHQLAEVQQQLVESRKAEQDLQARFDKQQQDQFELQRQASETEHNLQSQLNEEKQRCEHFQDDLDQLQRQSSSREVELWNVPRSDVKIDKEIGVGGWGSVSKGTFHGQVVAIKQLHPDIISRDNVSRLRREVRLMANVRHPNILLFIAAVFDEAVDQLFPPLIVLELLDVDLRKAYKANMVGLSNNISIFRDVACALNYLHCLHEPIIHRDLSAPNVLLEAMANNRWKAKVSDFGSANLARHAQTAAEGAIIYTAPECLPRELLGPHAPNFPQTPKIDVYSYGVLLCEVMTRTLPKELGPLILELNKWPSMHTIAITCTSYSPEDRPTISHVLTELRKVQLHKITTL